ncbi:MAG: PAS domain S-box protein [Smithella sp.]
MFNSSNHSSTRGVNPCKNKSLRVLIIDDSENDVLLIIRELKKGGYHPLYELAETAAAMEKALKDEIWDIILCDYKMPKFNAPSAIALLKKTNIDIPIIIISGAIGEEAALECMRLGARDYIMKNNLYRLCPAIARELKEAKNKKKQKKMEDERKKIEEALRKSELAFKSLFEASPVGIFKVADRKFLQVNPAMCRTTGYSSEDLIGQSVRICYRDDEEYERAGKILYGQVLQDGKGFVEVHLKRKNGGEFDALLCLNLIDPQGHYAGYEGIMMDITQRKLAEEKFHKIFMTSPDCIAITRMKDGFILDVNMGFEKITGWNGSNAIGQTSYEITFWNDIADRNFMINELRSGRDILHREFKFRRSDGSIRAGIYSARPINIDDETCLIFILQDITERKKAEEALKNSHRRLDDIIDFLPDATFVIDRDGKVITWNMSMERITEIPKMDMIGRRNYEYATPFYGQRRQLLIDLALLPDEVFENNHYENVYREGDNLYAEAYVPRLYGGRGAFMWGAASRLRDASGNIIGAIESIRDITERKQVEESLLKSEKKFASLFHLNPNPMAITDTVTGKIVDVNQAFTQKTGYSREEVIGVSSKDLHLWVNPEDRKRIIGILASAGEFNGKEIMTRRKNGDVRNVLLSTRVIEIDQKSHLLMLGHDITERRQAEEKYRSIFENAQEGIFRSTPEGRFIMANQSMARILGYDSPEDFISGITDIPRQLYVDPDDRARIIGMMDQQGLARSNEIRCYRKDGSIIWVSMTIMQTCDENGQVLYFEGIVEDITDRKRADEEIRRTEEQMRAFAARLQTVREEERTHIAREIHDELGGALTGIKIDFSLLTKAAGEIKEEILKDSLLDQMHNTMKNIDKTMRTVRKIATELRPGILDDLGILAALEWQLKDFQKHTGIRCEWISSLENINLDEQETTALFRIVQETLTNVVRHAEATEVRVHLRKEANTYVLNVEDNGKGITKNNIDDKRSLGLLGMRERTLAFGGRIDVEGHTERGTKVTVEIPFK